MKKALINCVLSTYNNYLPKVKQQIKEKPIFYHIFNFTFVNSINTY